MAMGKDAFRRILPSALWHLPTHPPSPGAAAVAFSKIGAMTCGRAE